ncbi:DJ-1 family glyoxalase III [Spiroplasma endosymbiont of Nebria brevicollis]|uniref:DJ-1 family glyoxalase III n=1 Tax=Spiroplasma endosymbiont of Nebria brevicollis TaxID=3066284 RepID=UPI00313CF6C4
MEMKAAIFLATGYEMGEAIITIDLLRRTNITVDIISIENDLAVTSSHNVKINCEKFIDKINFKEYKMLVLPGGNLGVENLNKKQLLKSKLIEFAKDNNKIIAAICGAPQILGQLNLLDNKVITDYPGASMGLNNSKIDLKKKVVVDGNIITGRSLGCVFEFGLTIIEKFLNKNSSENVKLKLVM